VKISELKNAPDWLRDARVENENVDVVDGRVIWRGGVWRDGVWRDGFWRGGVWRGGDWHGGVWLGGDWLGGVWRGGDWLGGVWRGGDWRGGDWRDGVWLDGDWLGGVWRDGDWRGGVWRGGDWHGGEDRLFFMASALGIIPNNEGMCLAYRTTNSDGSGRYTGSFVQKEGEYFEDDLPDNGSGTCVKGIHVTTAFCAWTYFGIKTDAQMWRVKFHICDLLDCVGEKARIRGGIFEKIERPF
jgi:hypothetical protein